MIGYLIGIAVCGVLGGLWGYFDEPKQSRSFWSFCKGFFMIACLAVALAKGFALGYNLGEFMSPITGNWSGIVLGVVGAFVGWAIWGIITLVLLALLDWKRRRSQS